jgi:NADPH:quinone reductase-like Zn-dependent oxidoreductase
MKTIVFDRYGPPSVLHLKEIPTPEAADGEVLIRIRAAAVTPSDAAFRSGTPVVARLFSGLRKPRIATLGDALAGDIVAVGREVTRFKVGDRVFGSSGPKMGAHAEYACLPQDAALETMSAAMSYAEGAGLADAGLTALPFLRDKGRVRDGHKVLINGAAGAVGGIAVQLAKHFGAEVTGVCSAANMALVQSLGADTVIDYAKADFTRNAEAYDVIFDAVGKSSFSRCKRALKPRGVYLTTVPTMAGVLQMLRTSLGGGKRAIFVATGLRKAGDRTKDLGVLRGFVEAGSLRIVIDRSYPLEEVAAAHAYVDTGHKKGTVVMTPEQAATGDVSNRD